MNMDPRSTARAQTRYPSTSLLEPIYRSISWVDVVNIRALNPTCHPTKAAMTEAAEHEDSVFGQEVETYIGKTPAGAPSRNAEQAAALRRLSILEDHEVTIDALRDTGLPAELAVDLVRRLLPRPTGWTIFERMVSTPSLHLWAQSVLMRPEHVHVAEDILTLRILQTFGHDVAVPWSLDTTNKWVYFYSAAPDPNGSLGRLLDIATLDRPNCVGMREICRKAYQALAYCHHGEGGQIWPHWEATQEIWEIHPDPREVHDVDDIVANHAVTCDTERWLHNVTSVGALDVDGYSPRTGPDYDSDLSDPENVACDARRARVSPVDLHERLAVIAAHRRAGRHARAAVSPQAQSPSQPSLSSPAASPSSTCPDLAPQTTDR